MASFWKRRIRQAAKRQGRLGELLVCRDQAGTMLERQSEVTGVIDTQLKGHGLI